MTRIPASLTTIALSGAINLIALATTPAVAAATPPTYNAEASIPLPDGRWDLVNFDSEHRRVLVARADSVTVVDVASGAVRSIGAVGRGHAALAIPGTKLIAVTSGQDDSLRLIDGDDGHETAKIAVGQNPDAAIWDPASRRVLVMNARSGTVSIVDPVAARVERTIMVKPALELAAMVGPRMLAINDEAANELELIDLASGVALPPIALTGCEGPTGVAYDVGDRMLLSACANGKAALVDMRSRRLVRLLPLDAGPDTVLFDSKRHRFLVPCGRSGTLAIFAVGRCGMVTAMEPVHTEISARTGAIDEVSGRVYLPAARFQPAEVGKRPQPVDGSFRLLVLSPAG